MPPEPRPARERRAAACVASVLPEVVAGAGLALAGLFAIANPDLFGHLAAGRDIARRGAVPRTDPFSVAFDPPRTWHNYEWASDWLFWSAWGAGGAVGVLALKALLLAIAAISVVRRARDEAGAHGAWIATLLLVVHLPALRFCLVERPHLLGYALGAWLLFALGRCVRAPSPRRALGWAMALGVTQVLWVNLHGSHLLGLGVVALHALFWMTDREARRRLGTILALQVGATFATPFGPAIVSDAVEHVVRPEYRNLVSEWGPWQPVQPLWWLLAPLAQGLLAAVLAPRMWRSGPGGRAALAAVLALLVLALRSLRFEGEFLVLSSALLAGPLAGAIRQTPLGRLTGWRGHSLAALAGGIAMILAVVGIRTLPPALPFGVGVVERALPAASGRWIERHLKAPRILAAMEDSWYLLFAAPGARVLIDGRVPFYGAEHVRRVARAFERPAALRHILERHRIGVAVLRPVRAAHGPALHTLRRLDGWVLALVEDRHALFVRDELAPGPPFQALPLGYAPDNWLAGGLDVTRAEAEITRLEGLSSARGYVAWARGMLALRPLVRAGGRAGLAPPRGPEERALAHRARKELARAATELGELEIVHSWHALAALAACELTEAEEALGRARRSGGPAGPEPREVLLATRELALRRGDVAHVRAWLESLEKGHDMRVREDPWLAALRAELRAPPRCPSRPAQR